MHIQIVYAWRSYVTIADIKPGLATLISNINLKEYPQTSWEKELNKFNNTGAWMLDSIYYMT